MLGTLTFGCGSATGDTATPPDASAAGSPSSRSAFVERIVGQPIEPTLAALRSALSRRGFEVLFVANIGATLARSADAWGPEYNRSGLDEIRSVLFCDPNYEHQAANEDPSALALCPFRVTLIEKDGETTIVLVRPSIAAASTKAASTIRGVEVQIIEAIDEAVAAAPETSMTQNPECRYDTQCNEGQICEAYQCIRWWKMRGDTPELAPEEVLALVERGEVQILDVRTAAEYRGGHIEGAVSVPLGKLERSADDLPLDRSRPIVVICLTAHRSIGAVRLLERKGYDIVQLEGGMRAWRKADLPEHDD